MDAMNYLLDMVEDSKWDFPIRYHVILCLIKNPPFRFGGELSELIRIKTSSASMWPLPLMSMPATSKFKDRRGVRVNGAGAVRTFPMVGAVCAVLTAASVGTVSFVRFGNLLVSG